MDVAFTHNYIFSGFLKNNSNGKKCSVLYCLTVLCNFVECNHKVKPVYGNYHKVFLENLA